MTTGSRGWRKVWVLAVIGAWVGCVLACRAAWSPDGTKVLFPFATGADRGGLALYDLKTGAVREVLPRTHEGDPFPFSAQWFSDGRRALVVTMADKKQTVLVLDVVTGKVEKRIALGKLEGGEMQLAWRPPLVAGRTLFFGGKELVRVDLVSGAITRQKAEGEPMLFAGGGGVYYASESRRVVRKGKGKGKETEKAVEFGRLDPKTLKREPWFTVRSDELSDPIFPTALGGGQVAIAARTEKALEIRVYAKGAKTPAKVVGLGAKKRVTLGNLQAAPDGKTLYAAYLRKADSPKGPRTDPSCGVVEVPLGGGAVRWMELLRLKKKGKLVEAMFQISLSPDGQTLAALTALLDEDDIRPEDRGLLLVDLKDPARKVKKIRAPAAAPPPAPKPDK